ncbi:hypothetical protein ACVWZT_000509 [Pseudomonas sp. TE21394]
MLKRFAPLVPLALVTLLFGCAAHGPASHSEQQPQDHSPIAAESAFKAKASSSSVFGEPQELATEDDLEAFSSSKPYQLPALADSILERGMSLIGTRYRFGRHLGEVRFRLQWFHRLPVPRRSGRDPAAFDA